MRNQNPGNIRRTAEVWKGMSTIQGDPDFVQFSAMKWGCRALVKTLRTYVEKRGLQTIRQIIGRWAPANENDTMSYIRSVSSAMRRDPDEVLHFSDDPLLYLDLAKAIARHECGPEAESISSDGWEFALQEAGV
ncbi:structural protein P5 [Sutterella sp.]|uniref:structural protein P5 n=1 Tax=Sutterella sp. TaxID=1981025 RepID=UPI0026DEEE20|nr:structural protein P5 [Sutterella sp.]MDO5531073.1 structural protein P5 [Sutterella sp.]